jgi:hypothetical protein
MAPSGILRSVTAATALTRRLAPIVVAAAAAVPIVNAAAPAPVAAAPAKSFTVSLQEASDKQIAVDNLSSYSNDSVAELVRWADRGMASKDPANTAAASGQMNTGDQVVVTNAAIYWLDVVDRGGLVSGAWPLANGANGPVFASQPLSTAPSWSPNAYLPASNADLTNPFDGGQTINVLPYGGHDASCEIGKGTWMIGNTANCGVPKPPVRVSITKVVSGSAHTYRVAGTMYQAGTDNRTMIDHQGKQAEVRFTLAYTFRDATNTVLDYGKHAGNQQRRFRTEVTLEPTAPITLGTLVIAGNSDDVRRGPSVPVRKFNFSNTTRAHWQPAECGPGYNVAANAVGALCERPGQVNWFQQNNLLPATLKAGDWVTQRQANSTKFGTDRATTLLVPNVSGYRLPERIDHIWNGGLGVTAFDVDYFNNEPVPVAAGQRLTLGFDTQFEPVVR